jgi:hypothetical protein
MHILLSIYTLKHIKLKKIWFSQCCLRKKLHQKYKGIPENTKEIGQYFIFFIKDIKMKFWQLWTCRLDCRGPNATFDIHIGICISLKSKMIILFLDTPWIWEMAALPKNLYSIAEACILYKNKQGTGHKL